MGILAIKIPCSSNGIFLFTFPVGKINAEIPVFALRAIGILFSTALSLAISKCWYTPDEWPHQESFVSIVINFAPRLTNFLASLGILDS